jgi:hypothetical protein
MGLCSPSSVSQRVAACHCLSAFPDTKLQWRSRTSWGKGPGRSFPEFAVFFEEMEGNGSIGIRVETEPGLHSSLPCPP